MDEFIRSYGLWILLAGVFLAMQWFGMGCGGGHRHRPPDRDDTAGGTDAPENAATKRAAPTRGSGGCH
jgi:hypothetical protein